MEKKIRNIMSEIEGQFRFTFNNKKTRDLIIEALGLKLGNSVIIECNEENNTPDIVDSGRIFARLRWVENNEYYKCDLIFGTLSVSDYRDIRIDEILKK